MISFWMTVDKELMYNNNVDEKFWEEPIHLLSLRTSFIWSTWTLFNVS
jgi:hypothetical protein